MSEFKFNKINHIPQQGFVYNVINKLISEFNKSGEEIKKLDSQVEQLQEDVSELKPKPFNGVTTIRIHQQDINVPIKITTDSEFGKDGTPETNAVSWIRANTHAYVGKYDYTNKVMKLKQLNDADYSYFTGDGTDYFEYTDDYITDANEEGYDVFIKLPKFWYKTVDAEDDSYVDISFALQAIDGYLEWDDTNLIGVYESWLDDNNKVRSLSGKDSTGNISWTQYKAYARDRNIGMPEGQGYRLVTFEQHSMMALLFYAYYGKVNDQKICGFGTNNYNKETGLTNYLGLTDTDKDNGNGQMQKIINVGGTDYEIQEQINKSIKFWGLENWYGNKSEWIDNIKCADNPGDLEEFNGEMWILDLDDNIKDRVIFPGGMMGTNKAYCDGWIQRIKTFGKGYLGFATGTDDGELENTSFTAYGCFYGFGSVCDRSGSCDNSAGGVAYLFVGSLPSVYGSGRCSRLAYIGNVEIVDSFDTEL